VTAPSSLSSFVQSQTGEFGEGFPVTGFPVEDLMRRCNGHASPSKALVRCLARELGITESCLEKFAEEVRLDLSEPCTKRTWE